MNNILHYMTTENRLLLKPDTLLTLGSHLRHPAPCVLRGGRKDGLAELTYGFVVKYLGEASIRVLAPELPHVKERLPVDEVHQPLQVVVLEDPRPQERGLCCREEAPRSTRRHACLAGALSLPPPMRCPPPVSVRVVSQRGEP